MSETATPAAFMEPTDSLNLWADNPRNNASAVAEVARSIAEFGFAAPIVANLRDRTVIAGNTRLLAARKLGLAEVPVRWLDLEPAAAHALALADNKLGEIATWDDEKLAAVLAEVSADANDLLAAVGFSDEELARLLSPDEAPAGPAPVQYTRKITVPIYEPKGRKPAVAELFDDAKCSELRSRIDDLGETIPPEVAAFLRRAAERHVRFNFAAVAEFYAHADAATQALFEESALVIVDFNRAIELGFVTLADELFAVAEAEGGEHA